MAGQESSETAETLLNMVADCDLIFDATANPDILNLMSAVVAFAKKPVIWAEVFGGAIGGLIARCRPGIEPSPQHMRWAIENWFGERGTPVPVSPKRSYLTGSDAAPLIADDADVAVIAAHAARFAIDTLIPREPSHYPYSVYAIGLANGSVFSQPFDTHPIDVGPCPASEAGQELSQEEQIAEIARILELFKARVNAPANPDQNNQSP
jgi:hypothetical protein